MKKELPKSVQFVKGVGPRYACLLEKINVYTVEDLLYYFPRDYQDRRKLARIKYLNIGELVTIEGEVLKVSEEKPRPGLSILKVTFTDGTDVLNGVWFNQPYLKKQFKKGERYFLSGELNEKSWRYGKKEIYNPVFEQADEGESIHTGRIVPIYSLTSGMTQKRLRQIIYNALEEYSCHLPDLLPENIKKKYGLPDIAESIRGLHFPEDRKDYIRARVRLAFEELFLLQLMVLQRKKGNLEKTGILHRDSSVVIERFLDSLPFKLTAAHERVWNEIERDM